MMKTLLSYNITGAYDEAVRQLRAFFTTKEFIEVEVQSRRSILAACEDPNSIATYTFAGVKWPLPQTGQMWLEHELLGNPDVKGVFCVTTSYRHEQKPDPARHLSIFPMFEFETHGDMSSLQLLLGELCEWLGFGPRHSYQAGDYETIAEQYNCEEIAAAEELRIGEEYSHVFMLKNFPFSSHPFWNMKKEGMHAKKIDTLLFGVETIGSAERSCDASEMYEWFHTIKNGEYAEKLFGEFGKERVERELQDFLSHNFFPRFGGGIGLTRLMRAMALNKELSVESCCSQQCG